MSDDYEDLLAEMAKLGRLEIQPKVGVFDDEVDLSYPLGEMVLTVTVMPDRTLRVWIVGQEADTEGWDAVVDHLHSFDPQAKREWFAELLETLRRHLEGQVWLPRLLLEMR